MQILEFSDSKFFTKLDRLAGRAGNDPELSKAVAGILEKIAKHGDKAVIQFSKKFDAAKLTAASLRIPKADLKKAAQALDKKSRAAIDEAIACVTDFHKRTLPENRSWKNPHGATVGERFYAVPSAGLYVPGGQVPLVSTVIMTCIPARLAGVPRIAVCTPPRPDGSVDASLLAALHLCGIEEVYRIGGVQAVGAMAFGTKTIERTDVIAGPGNAYVMEAQRQLFGRAGVRLLPGPSEIMVIGDKTAKPEWMAAELLAQAEHGTGKERIYLALTDKAQIQAVWKSMIRQLPELAHAAKIQTVMKKGFIAIYAKKMADIIEVANLIAPEHLQVMVDDKDIESVASGITTAGAMLLGHLTPTVLGDFTAGPSHTLPTGRTGRFFSGLQATDFIRRSSVVHYGADSLRKARAVVEAFSAMEQLDAHGRSLSIRIDG